jgi:hypothetical protein
MFAQLDRGELHRCVDRDVNRELGRDAVLPMLEHAVAEAVARDVRAGAAARHRGRRPEASGFVVAHEAGFAARVGHGVVVPGREPELVRVLVPGVGEAALGDDRAEFGLARTLTHGVGRRRPAQRDDVLASRRA